MEFREGTVVREISRYRYPDNLDLRPQGPLSQQICARILQNATASHGFMEKKYAKWREIDRKNHAFIPADSEQIRRRVGEGADYGDHRLPMSITFPYSFAIKKSIIAHLTNRNLRGPLHRLTGHGVQQDMLRAQLLAVVINQEANYWDAARRYHHAYQDAFDYGLCFVSCNFETEWMKTTRQDFGAPPLPEMLPVMQNYTEWEIRFEGSKCSNIDPYRALPDPHVALDDIDDAEFFYYLDQEGLNALIAKDNRGEYFNVSHMRERTSWKSTFELHNSNRGYIRNLYGDIADMDPTSEGTFDLYDLSHPVCIKGVQWIIPSEFPGNGLAVGDGDQPVLYEFVVAADEYILKFNPVAGDQERMMIPVAAAALNADGYSLTPTAPMEYLLGPQEFIDWAINTYTTEVMQSVNGREIYDPLIIREDDMNSNKQRMRIRQRYWGQGKLKDAHLQLQGSAAAAQHIQYIPLIQDFMNRGAGASEILQGVMRSGGERRSATESESTKEMGLGRIDEMSFLMKMMLHKRLTRIFAENCIQHKSQGGWHRAVDDWPDELRDEFGDGPVYVDPKDINVPYDVMVEEDADSMGSEASTALLNQLLNIALTSQHPSMEQVDPIQWMKMIARRSGERSVQRLFRKNPRTQQPQGQIMDDEQLGRQVEAGNMVPMEQAMGGGEPLALPSM